MQAIRILCAVLTFEGSLEIVYVKLGPVIVTPGVGSVGDLDVLVLEQWLVCALDILVGQGTDGSLSLLAAGVLDSHGQQEQHRPNCQTFPKLHLVLQDVCCTTHQNWCYFFLWSSPMAVVHARSMGEHGKLFLKKNCLKNTDVFHKQQTNVLFFVSFVSGTTLLLLEVLNNQLALQSCAVMFQ